MKNRIDFYSARIVPPAEYETRPIRESDADFSDEDEFAEAFWRVDRYLATSVGTQAALAALAEIRS